MPATYQQAIDEMYTILDTSINASSTAIVGYIPTIYWPGDKPVDNVDGSKFWLRVAVQTLLNPQATFSNDVGAANQRRYTSKGILIFQVFCPQSVDSSYVLGQRLAILIRDSYRRVTTPGGVWFSNARIKEIPSEEIFYRFNVIVDFQFDDIS